jgi:hypothetical protein
MTVSELREVLELMFEDIDPMSSEQQQLEKEL